MRAAFWLRLPAHAIYQPPKFPWSGPTNRSPQTIDPHPTPRPQLQKTMASSQWILGASDLDVKALLVAALGATVSYWLYSVVVHWYSLRHVPGPFITAVTSLYAFWWMKKSDFNTFVLDLRKNYGGIVRLAPTAVLIDDPDEARRINSARSVYNRGGWYASMKFNPWGDTVLTEMSPVHHDKRKAKLIHGYSGRGIHNVERRLDTQIAVLKDVLKTRIEKASADGQRRTAVLDVAHILHYFQIDLIAYTGLGESWGNMTEDKDHFDYVKESGAATSLAHSAAMVPFLRWILFSDAFLRVFGPSRTDGWLG